MMVAKPALSSADVAEDSWASKAPMHQARGGLGVAVVNGKIYAIGGSTEKGEWSISGSVGTGGVVGTNEEYDPALDTWVLKTPMPTPRIGFSIVIYQNKIYCIGGATKTPRIGAPTRTEVIEAYDPATNTWKTKTPMPTRRDNYAIIEYQNKIYFIGGTTGSNYTTGLPLYTGLNEVYDPTTDTWETKTPMPTAKVAEANVVNGKIYFIGGSPNNTLNQVYDLATDSWAIKTPMPTEAYGASIIIDNKIYVIGGSYSGSQFYTLNQIYDPETDKWSQGAPPPSVGVRQGSAVATTGERAPKRIYVLDETLRVYNPETDSWTFGANIPTNRLNLGIALVNDMLYAIGGNTYTYQYLLTQIRGGSVTPYATNEQYTPFGYGIVPSVVSPETNKTYVGSDVPLTFTLGKPASWIGYSLDGQETVTITGNTTIAGLSSGLHNITVYAKDAFENTGASETITFTVAEKPEPFPTTLVATATVSVAVVGVGLLVYFRKRNHLLEKQQTLVSVSAIARLTMPIVRVLSCPL
jgi:hypothetical protein